METECRSLLTVAQEAGLDVAKLRVAFDKSTPNTASEVWSILCRDLLRPHHDFGVHQALFAATYKGWSRAALGPPPIWLPSPSELAASNVALFLATFKGDAAFEGGRQGNNAGVAWPLLHELSWRDPQALWPAVLRALGVLFHTPPHSALQLTGHNPDAWRWLPGARLNIAAAALLCPLVRSPAAPAIVWAEEGAPTVLLTLSLAQLRQQCQAVAACVRSRFKPGEAIAIDMPMTVTGSVIYLGVVLAGCVVVSIPESFAPDEIRTRLRIAHASAIFTQDVVLRGGKALPLYMRVVEADGPLAIVLPASAGGALRVELRHGDVSWREFQHWAPELAADAELQPHVADAYAHTGILFSSGTTGEPKAIPWTHLTPLRAAVDAWSLMDVRPGSTVCWPTSLGWMMGPWLLYAALLNGATVAMYQGSPLGRDFGEFVSAARVTMLGVVPSIVRAWRHTDCMKGLDWSSHLRCYSSTGEASAAEDQHWLMAHAGYKPVVEYCGGTEIGGAFIAGSLLQPQVAAAFSTPTLGCRLLLLPPEAQGGGAGGSSSSSSSSSSAAGAGDSSSGPCSGELALVPPVWGASQSLLNKDHFKVYYEGMPRHAGTGRPLRRHGDEFQRLPGNFYVALGRCDDTMNVGGIKVSSVELERVVLEAVLGVAEAAAVGVPAPGGGPEQLHLFIVLRSGGSGETGGKEQLAKLKALCNDAIKTKLNPLFKVEQVLVRGSLPRTASNKVMRRLLRDELPGRARL